MSLKLIIVQDTDPFNPRTEYHNFGTMVCFHNRYSLGDKTNIDRTQFNSWDEMEAYIIKKHKAVIILPLYLYDHSVLTISTTPFSCKWDSGQIGFIYADRESILSEYKRVTKKAKEWALRSLLDEVTTYDQYMTGDTWGYVIRDSEHNEIESCYGFYGKEYCTLEGNEVLKKLTNNKITV